MEGVTVSSPNEHSNEHSSNSTSDLASTYEHFRYDCIDLMIDLKTIVFKNSRGERLRKALFYETRNPEAGVVPVYTLKDQDHPLGYPSLYRLYMEMEDLTEWEFATTHLSGWEHWELLCECSWFKPVVRRWRKELELKIKARALRNMAREAKGHGKNSFIANKYLADKGWIERATGKVGRPPAHEAREDKAWLQAELKEDLKRLELN